jgi:uncharacterized protein (TIGR04255 family)
MLERKHYPNPPLVEVYGEFLFAQGESQNWDIFKLSEFFQRIGGAGRFPERRESGGFKRALRSDSKRRAGRSSAPIIWQFISGDANTVVQVGENTLVVNQLPPYYGWEKFVQDVETAVRSYLDLWAPAGVAKAGLHYFDNVEIPGEAIALEDYFNFAPVIPNEWLKRSLLDVAMSCDLEGDERGEVLSFTFGQHESASTEPQVAFRLTWDYQATESLPAELPSILAFLDRAHTRTSEAFRASLTEKCAALFEGK